METNSSTLTKREIIDAIQILGTFAKGIKTSSADPLSVALKDKLKKLIELL